MKIIVLAFALSSLNIYAMRNLICALAVSSGIIVATFHCDRHDDDLFERVKPVYGKQLTFPTFRIRISRRHNSRVKITFADLCLMPHTFSHRSAKWNNNYFLFVYTLRFAANTSFVVTKTERLIRSLEDVQNLSAYIVCN